MRESEQNATKNTKKPTATEITYGHGENALPLHEPAFGSICTMAAGKKGAFCCTADPTHLPTDVHCAPNLGAFVSGARLNGEHTVAQE